MATPKKINKSEIKAAIAAIMKRKRPDLAQLRLDERARLMALRGKLERQLEPLFAEAGLDIAKINKILADHESEVGSVLEKEKTKYAKTFAAPNKDLRRAIENQRKALEQIAFKPLIITSIPLWTAFEIYELPGNIPFQSHIEAGNNWAVTTFEKGTDGSGVEEVYFWFAWRNPSVNLAVLGAECDLALQGTCRVHGNSHFLFSGDASLDLYAELIAYTGIYPNSGPPVEIKFLGAPPDNSAFICDTYHVPGPDAISVSGGSLVLFAVHFWVYYDVYNGLASFDFESPGFILCPSVQLELLTPPPVIAP
jgi:hypothetical protein